MKTTLKITLLISFLLGSLAAFAGADVAKVIILRGQAKAKDDSNKVFDLQKDQWIQEGTVIQTADKSFVKLLFIDKSQINLGPKSQMLISKFPKKDAGIITLLKGQVRSKVSKNYMDMKDKDKSKLFIKTKTAAMGVRGTDFQVVYNNTNEVTSLVTFEGAVAMAKITEDAQRGKFDQETLEKIVSSKEAVMVKRGQYSGASHKLKKSSLPQKISPTQFEVLKNTEDPNKPNTNLSQNGDKSKYRSVVPPGVSGKTFVSESTEVAKEISKTTGEKVNGREPASTPTGYTPPEGVYNEQTGDYAPPAGGFVDLDTGLYVPPPPGSAFDPNTQTYTPPPSVGTVNERGEYDAGAYDLKPDGTYELKDEQERAPASSPDGAPRPDDPPPPPPPVKNNQDKPWDPTAPGRMCPPDCGPPPPPVATVPPKPPEAPTPLPLNNVQDTYNFSRVKVIINSQ